MQNVHCHFISQIVDNKTSSPDLYGRNFPTAGQVYKQDLWLPVSAQVTEATKRVRLGLRREVSNLPFQLCWEMDGWILPNNSHILKSHALDLNLGAALKTRALADKRIFFYLLSLPWTFFDSWRRAIRASGGLRPGPGQPVCAPVPQGDLWRLSPYLPSQDSSWSPAPLTASEDGAEQSTGSTKSGDKDGQCGWEGQKESTSTCLLTRPLNLLTDHLR